MDKSYKKPLLLITFGVILFAAFNNLNYVANFLKSCIGLLAPILSGLLLAFVLSVPVRGLAKRLRRKLTKATDRQIDMISLLLTLICVIAIRSLYWRISLLRFRHFIYFIGGSEQGAPMLDRLSGNSVC